MVTIYSL